MQSIFYHLLILMCFNDCRAAIQENRILQSFSFGFSLTQKWGMQPRGGSRKAAASHASLMLNPKDDLMDEIHDIVRNKSDTPPDFVNLDFEAQLVAALMVETNAFVSIKTAAKLCSISRQEIDRRVHNGTFPTPIKLSSEDKAIRKAFYLNDIQQWLEAPQTFRRSEHSQLH